MSGLYSEQWHRVAALRPRLRPQVSVRRQVWRGQSWWVLSDAGSGRQHRINESAYQFIGRCDGKHSVDDVWHEVLRQQREAAPTQDEVMGLLGALNESELLQSERGGDTGVMLKRRSDNERARRRRMLDPFAFRLPLGDPMSWLRTLDPFARAVFSPWALAAWGLLMVFGLALVLLHGPVLWTQSQALASDTSLLWLLWLIYPLMKALHELGHALALRRFDVETHEVGLGLLFLLPAPYVQATGASALASRWARMLVSAAGVMVELAIAALCLIVWTLTEPGSVHDAALLTAGIALASTLLFNGNPLLRYDGYHIASDALALPNWAARSEAWWSRHLAHWLLGVSAHEPLLSDGERFWLIGYAPLSIVYRLALMAGMVVWLSGHGLLFALLAAAYGLVTLLLLPVRRWVRNAQRATQPGAAQQRLRLRLAATALVAGLLVFVMPLPDHSLAQGVVGPPEQAQLRAEVDGFVRALPVADGQTVRAGQLVMQLDNPELRTLAQASLARLEALRVQQYQGLLRDAQAAQNLQIELANATREAEQAQARVAQLSVRAQSAGRLVMPHQADLLGSFQRRGALLGELLAPETLQIKVAVPHADAPRVRDQLAGVEVRLSDALATTHAAQVVRMTPAANRQLPHAALGVPAGGRWAVDPAQRDGLLARDPFFLVELRLPGQPLARSGARAWVRFDHGQAPLATQIYRRSTQLFLRHLRVES